MAMLLHRLTKKKTMMAVTVSAALLLFISFQASRSMFLNTKPHQLTDLHRLNSGLEEGDGGVKTSKIILMTYGRSGSSFTSEVIQRDPGVFYTFEPLFNLMQRFNAAKKGGSQFKYHNTTMGVYDKESMDIIQVFLNCGFESMNVYDINNFQLRNSQDSRQLWGCVSGKRNATWTPMAVVECFLRARKVCLQRQTKMVKVIRLRGSAARAMMETQGDLKIIYLLRDPRGTLASQKRVFNNFKWENTGNFSAQFCTTFREDLRNMGHLMDVYPDRVRLLRYETLAENPLKTSQEMYGFLGLNFTDSVREFVVQKTMSGEKPKNPYSTSRSNSTETAYAWRKSLTFSAARLIDENCGDIYRQLGYLPVSTQAELLDFAHALRTQVTFHGQSI